MFNRANKMTALLVAAAAVVSLVPATGVNAADYKRINSEDGKIYHAVAFKDGQFYLDGEVDGKDESAYYLSSGKYSELDKLDSNSEAVVYGEKYVNVDDGEYFVDLTNGKVDDDDIKEENKDDAQSALKKKIKDKADDRYSDHADEQDLTDLAGNKFGENWYKTTYSSNKNTNGKSQGTVLKVYTDAKGNYIDADYNLGKIKVELTSPTSVKMTDKTVTLDNTDSNKKVGEVNGNKNVKAELSAAVLNSVEIGQDSKNIYRIAQIELTATNGVTISQVNGNSSAETFAGIGSSVVKFNAIQKISKDQSSDTIDGAKYAKSVTTYAICNDEGNISGEDVETFAELVNGLTSYDPTSNLVPADAVSKSSGVDAMSAVKFTITNNTVIAYRENLTTQKVSAQALTLKSKAGLYYTEVEEIRANKDSITVDTDVDGNLWRLDGGFVYKFDNKDDWDKEYKVDGSMTEMSVYDKNHMVLWDEDDEVYSIIGVKEDKEEEKPEVEVKAGWSQAADGTWTFVNADNTKATGWFQDGANWYLANAAGVMQTEWQTINGTWFYLGSNGAMQTGWQNINGAWYYLNPVSDGTRGAMKTGWINDNGTWYFADGSGKMLANTTVNGYVLGANGAWVK